MIRILSFATLLIYGSCSTDAIRNVVAGLATDQVKPVKQSYKYEYQVNNEDVNQFGYQVWEGDEDTGTKTIAIDDNHAYLVDTYHNAVKKIDLSNGEIVANESLDTLPAPKTRVWLRDIAVFKDRLYVTSDEGVVYSFSKDLEVIDTFEAPMANTTFYKANSDSLLIYYDSEQAEDLAITKTFGYVDDRYNFSTITKRYSIKDYKSTFDRLQILGKDYEIKQIKEKAILKNDFGLYEFKVDIPTIRAYAARNLDFNKDRIVFFDTAPQKLTLYSFEY